MQQKNHVTVSRAQWQEMLAKAHKVVDGLGMPIDAGILETVAIMRCLGINTHMSCEGHMDRGYGPYVSFEHKEADDDRKRIAQAKRDFKGKRGEINYAEREIITKLAKGDIAQRRILLPYLDEFYAKRNTLQSQRLVISNLGFGAGILHCQNAILIGSPSGESLETRRSIMQKNQEEMFKFTEFLKSKVLG